MTEELKVEDLVKESERKMNKTLENLCADLATMRAGRATPSILDKIVVPYYGVDTPLAQMANVSVPDSRTLMIQPWDKNVLKDIEKALMKSDLGLTPNNDGATIRLNVPQLTEERRRELVKNIKKRAEEARVAVRNVRREINDKIKDAEKKKCASEDDCKWGVEECQKITDEMVKKIDGIIAKKEKEVMEI